MSDFLQLRFELSWALFTCFPGRILSLLGSESPRGQRQGHGIGSLPRGLEHEKVPLFDFCRTANRATRMIHGRPSIKTPSFPLQMSRRIVRRDSRDVVKEMLRAQAVNSKGAEMSVLVRQEGCMLRDGCTTDTFFPSGRHAQRGTANCSGDSQRRGKADSSSRARRSSEAVVVAEEGKKSASTRQTRDLYWSRTAQQPCDSRASSALSLPFQRDVRLALVAAVRRLELQPSPRGGS